MRPAALQPPSQGEFRIGAKNIAQSAPKVFLATSSRFPHEVWLYGPTQEGLDWRLTWVNFFLRAGSAAQCRLYSLVAAMLQQTKALRRRILVSLWSWITCGTETYNWKAGDGPDILSFLLWYREWGCMLKSVWVYDRSYSDPLRTESQIFRYMRIKSISTLTPER